MNKKSIAIGFILGALASFSVGALSNNAISSMANELGNRIYRDRNNQYMIGGWSPTSYWYFQGRIDARLEDLYLLDQIEQMFPSANEQAP